MKLYVTPLSPYARFARIVVIEKGLEDRVSVVHARTRVAGSPYYETATRLLGPVLLQP